MLDGELVTIAARDEAIADHPEGESTDVERKFCVREFSNLISRPRKYMGVWFVCMVCVYGCIGVGAYAYGCIRVFVYGCRDVVVSFGHSHP